MSTLLTPDIGKNFVAKLLCRLRFKVLNFSLEKLQIFLHPSGGIVGSANSIQTKPLFAMRTIAVVEASESSFRDEFPHFLKSQNVENIFD